ncbi:MAG TPA: hypothetical protein VF157_13630 [Chloroflexota bacterium]
MDSQPRQEAITCRRCKHYRISWDPKAPHACAAINFKSERLPCIVVYEESGIECQVFEPKPGATTRR